MGSVAFPGSRIPGYVGGSPLGAVLRKKQPGGPLKQEPATLANCCTPLVVIAPTWVSMFWRALKMPQLARSADVPLPVMSQAKPMRGWNSFFWFGSLPVEGNAGSLRYWPYEVCDGGTTGSGKIWASQRKP